MTEFEKGVYSDMKPVDRVLLYMCKVMELLELQKIMTKDDICLIKSLLKDGDGK